MGLAVRISLLICVVIYFAIGFFGYLLFGDSIMPDVLVNFDQNSDTNAGRLLNVIVRLSYALHLALVFPIMNYSLRANIDELIFSNKDKPPLALDTPRFVSLTLILLALTYLVAVAIPNIWYFFQFLGSTTVVCSSFIFPAAIVLRYVTTNFSALFICIIMLNLYINILFYISFLYFFEHRDLHSISKTIDRMMAIVVIVLAVGTSAIAIWTNLSG